MGKGTITADLGAGQYTVTINLDTARTTQEISDLEETITALEARIGAMPAGDEKTRLTLVKKSYEKRKEWLEDNLPEDESISAWCADYTEELTGVVGTVEVPGERGAVNIQPGYDGNAVYSSTRDGQIQRAIASDPVGAFYNWAMMPGWQKWKPTFRYGTITSILANTCAVTLDEAESSQQSLDVNQTTTLTGVPIEYMYCHGAAFAVDDEVLVMFTGQDWINPKVIGFKIEPKECPWVEEWMETLCEVRDWTVHRMMGLGYIGNDPQVEENVDHGSCPSMPVYEYDSHNNDFWDWVQYADINEYGTPSVMKLYSQAFVYDWEINMETSVSWTSDVEGEWAPVGEMEIKVDQVALDATYPQAVTEDSFFWYYVYLKSNLDTELYITIGYIDVVPGGGHVYSSFPDEFEAAYSAFLTSEEYLGADIHTIDLTGFFTGEGEKISTVRIGMWLHSNYYDQIEGAFDIDYIRMKAA